MLKAVEILKPSEARKVTGLGKTQFYEKQNPKSRYYDPSFPVAVELGGRSVGYYRHELENWLESRPRSRAGRGNPMNSKGAQAPRPGAFFTPGVLLWRLVRGRLTPGRYPFEPVFHPRIRRHHSRRGKRFGGSNILKRSQSMKSPLAGQVTPEIRPNPFSLLATPDANTLEKAAAEYLYPKAGYYDLMEELLERSANMAGLLGHAMDGNDDIPTQYAAATAYTIRDQIETTLALLNGLMEAEWRAQK